MLPDNWLDFIFPESLRSQKTWIDQFSKNRRSYVTGFAQAASNVRFFHSDDVHEGRSPAFAEDPRRIIPMVGWRERFRHHGEAFSEDEKYSVPPLESKRLPCLRWGAYGKDQPEHAWLHRPMRLYDALKSVALLYEAADRHGKSIDFTPHGGEFSTVEPEIGIHLAIFRLPQFDQEYYAEYFGKIEDSDEGAENRNGNIEKNIKNKERLGRLFEKCRLIPNFYGESVRTFEEMANGMSATHRTCTLLKEFVAEEKMPSIGSIQVDLSARGTNRTHRTNVKIKLRTGQFQKYSADCAIEIFFD